MTLSRCIAIAAASAAIVAALLVGGAGSARADERLANAGFEDGPVGGAPRGWYVPPAVRESGYAVRVTSDRPASGERCVEISLVGTASRNGFGNVLQSVEPAPLRGRRFRLTSRLRASGGGRAQMWLRVDRPNGAMGFFDNMGTRPVRTDAWTEAQIVGTIDADAEAITLGAILIGPGTAWADDFRLEVGDALDEPTARADGPDLFAAGGFDGGGSGWTAAAGAGAPDGGGEEPGGWTGGGGLHVSGPHDPRGGAAVCSAAVAAPPNDSALKISGWIRGQNLAAAASLGAMACLSDGTVLACATTRTSKTLRGDFEWTYVETVMPAVPRIERLEVFLLVEGGGDAWFDDVRVRSTTSAVAETPAPRARPPAPRPGLVLVRGEFDLVAGKPWNEPRVLIPLPLSYREQAPLTYELRTRPADALVRASIREDRPGNFVVEATFRPMDRDEPVRVSWRSLVLCGERSFADVPTNAPIPAAWAEEALPWLRSTWCVEAAHPRFVALGRELRADTDDVLEIVRRVKTRAAEVYANADGHVENLTAVEALDKGGSCTSCANLVAALLRASGVPARILSGYPLWSGPLQTHYIVEAFVPGYGWYPIESTMCRSPWQPYQQVEVSIVPPEYEEEKAARRRMSAAGGVPYLSLTEIEGESGWTKGEIEGAEFCDHVAELARELPAHGFAPDWELALDAARATWKAWLSGAQLDASRRLATPLQPDDITATSAAELARVLAR